MGSPTLDAVTEALRNVEDPIFQKPLGALGTLVDVRLDRRGELHAIVGRLRLAAMHRLAALAREQQHTPATGTGIATASTVGINLNCFGQSGFATLYWWFLPARRQLLVDAANADVSALTC